MVGTLASKIWRNLAIAKTEELEWEQDMKFAIFLCILLVTSAMVTIISASRPKFAPLAKRSGAGFLKTRNKKARGILSKKRYRENEMSDFGVGEYGDEEDLEEFGWFRVSESLP